MVAVLGFHDDEVGHGQQLLLECGAENPEDLFPERPGDHS
jgi:hypothetical protein